MIKEEFEKLLLREWIEEEREMIKRIMDGILYYKTLLPKSLKQDVISALALCNELKIKLEKYEQIIQEQNLKANTNSEKVSKDLHNQEQDTLEKTNSIK